MAIQTSLSMLIPVALQAPMAWFPNKPALIQGIVFLGASIGSIYTPILVNNVTRWLSFDWAIRITAFTYLFFLVKDFTYIRHALLIGFQTIASFTIKPRFSPSPRKTSLQDIASALKDPWYMADILAFCLAFMSFYVPLNFIVVQAQA